MECQRPVSRADQILSDRLKTDGYQIEPRQLERWRADGGVVDRSARTGAFDQARQVKQLLDDGLTLEEIALVQFMRDRHVTTPALKRALHNGLASALGPDVRTRNWTQARKRAEQQAEHTIKQMARDPSTKELRQEIKATAGRSGERVNQAVARVIATVYMLGNFGEAPTRSALQELLTAAGLPASAIDVDAIAREVGRTTRHDLEDALATASREALDQARTDHAAFTRWMVAFNLLPARAPRDEHVVAVSLLVLLVLRERLGDGDTDWVIQVLESTLPPNTG